jgi:hypothetical protein
VVDHERDYSTRKVVNGGNNGRDQKVKEETEERSFQPAFKGVLAKRALRDRLQNSNGAQVEPDSEENARVGDIEESGDQPGNENYQQRIS